MTRFVKTATGMGNGQESLTGGGRGPFLPLIDSAPQPRMSLTYSCGGCDNRWSGVSRAHCSVCHETFGGAAFFDRHRREKGGKGYCLHPSQIAKPVMHLTPQGVWMSVENPVKRDAPKRWAS